MLSYKKLDVYQCAIQFLALAATIVQKIPCGYSFLSDELKRASVSIPQNIAEGAGKTSDADKSRYYAIARAYAMECGAVLAACDVLKLADADILRKGDEL